MENDQTTGGTPKGTIRNMTALPRPILATSKTNGRLVNIVALGDVAGHSPSCWLVNESGEIDLASTRKFTVLDPAFLPPDRETFTRFAQTVKGDGSSSQY